MPAGRQPEETELKSTSTLKGNATNHPEFVKRWMRVGEASTAVGDLLKAGGDQLRPLLRLFRLPVRIRLPPLLQLCRRKLAATGDYQRNKIHKLPSDRCWR